MEKYEVSRKITDFSTRINELKNVVNLDNLKKEIQELEAKTFAPNFYNDQDNAQKVIRELNSKKSRHDDLVDLIKLLEELELYFEMYDWSLVSEIVELIERIETDLSKYEVDTLLSGEYDDSDAILEIHPGAGGTESQDWAEMLFRMYKRYAERNNFEFEVLDYQDGDEAGLKSATIIVRGNKAYGYLKSEHGVHRLIRISPFDSNKRRHTSFVAITVTPQIDKNINIEIKPEDVRIDTYRASGAGGQHVNKTDSAIRITQDPTGIVVQCQNDRSQHRNRAEAMQMLKSRLYELEMRQRNAEQQKLEDAKTDVGWGHQIRSYVLDQSRIKDLRTNVEISNTQRVLDGDLDPFIQASLKMGV